MSLLSLRDDVQRTIAQAVSGFAQVDTHGGRFDMDEIKRWAKRTPCCVVGILSVNSSEFDGTQVVANVEFGAFVVTKDQKDLKRDAAAIVMTDALFATVTPLQRFGADEAVHAPTDMAAANLYNGKLDQEGIALWAFTWTQGYDIARFDLALLSDFLRYRSSIQISENPDTPTGDDAVDLPAPDAE